MNRAKTYHYLTYFFWGLVVFTTIYVLIKSIIAPVTFEESREFLEVVYAEIAYPWQAFDESNYSFLNNLLVWLCYTLFGTNEWVIRLPNVLSFGLFLYYLLRLSKKLTHKLLKVVLVVSFLLSIFIIDFFALSMPYGISLAFLIAFLFHFKSYLETKKINHFYWASLFVIIATAANIEFIFICTSFFLFSSVSLTLKGSLHRFWAYGLTLYFVPFYAILAYQQNINPQLYIYPRYTILDSFNRLQQQLFNLQGEWFKVYVLILCSLLFVWLLFTFRKGLKSGFAIYLLFVANIFLIISLKKWGGINFSFEFTALHLWTMLIISVVFALDSLRKKGLILIILLPLMLLPVKYISQFSFTHYSNKNLAKRQVSYHLYKEIVSDKNGTASWPYNFSYPFVFQNLKDSNTQVYVQPESVFPNPSIKVIPSNSKIDSTVYEVLHHDKFWTLLNRRTDYSTVVSKNYIDYLFITNRQYIILDEYLVDKEKRFEINFSFEAFFRIRPSKAVITLDCRDEKNKSLLWKTVDIKNIKNCGSKFEPFSFSLGIDNIPEKTEKLSVYIYNVDEEQMDIRNISIVIKAP